MAPDPSFQLTPWPREDEPGGRPGYPLNSDRAALVTVGYVEQEFLLHGQAQRYHITDPCANAKTLAGYSPYTTRLLARFPADPRRFNGTVVVEWLNVSTGQDIDFVYGATRELLWRQGMAWVGVSAQRMGVEALTRWNAQRYAHLNVQANNTLPDGVGLLDAPDATTAAIGGDVLCWDIFLHVALAVVQPGSPLLGGLRPDLRIAAGESQSAFRLSTYYNSIHPLHCLYDGFLLYDRGGPFALREDVGTPLIAFGSEFMSEYLGPSQPDSRWLRWWEVAGAAHGSLDEFEHYIDPQVLRDGAMMLDGQAVTLSAMLQHQSGHTSAPLWSRVPNGDVMKAALHALRRWIMQGHSPAKAPRLLMNDAGQLKRDAQGRVQGGIRTAAYEVPMAHNLGVAATGCALAGAHLDFSPSELTQRYGTPQLYAQQVAQVNAANVAAGFLLEEEAAAQLAHAHSLAFGPVRS